MANNFLHLSTLFINTDKITVVEFFEEDESGTEMAIIRFGDRYLELDKYKDSADFLFVKKWLESHLWNQEPSPKSVFLCKHCGAPSDR